MNLIRKFITASQDLLASQLRQLENNVDTEARAIRLAMLDGFSDVRDVPLTTPRSARLTKGQLLRCDTGAGSAFVALDRPRAELAGKLAALVKIGGGTVTVTVAPPLPGGVQGKVNGASSATPSAGLHLFLCDGRDWWF